MRMYLIHSLKFEPANVTFWHKFINENDPEALLLLLADIWKRKEQSLIRNESLIKHPNEKLGLGSNNIIYNLERDVVQ